MLKGWNHSTTTRKYAVTYYQTLKEVLCLGLIELKKRQQIFKKIEKNNLKGLNLRAVVCQ